LDDIEPCRFVVFLVANPRVFRRVTARTMVEARLQGAEGMSVRSDQVWSVIPGEGETDASAIRRALELDSVKRWRKPKTL
jgi:hypothetical protein